MAQTLLRTPLYERQVELGARMVPFAGWELPMQYEGVLQECRAVRTDAGVFDVSHMGELEVEGPRAHGLLQKVPHTNRYQVTAAGREIITALLTARHTPIAQLAKAA